MIKIIWLLIGVNAFALLIFIGAYFVLNHGRNVDYQEKGWTTILALVGLMVIFLAAIPLRLNQSTGTLIFSGLFAALPLVIALGIYLPRKFPIIKKPKTFAATYYRNKIQRAIAAAIENNDIVALKELIKGRSLDIKGVRVWDQDGLNYLQFAIRIRSNPIDFPFNEEANREAIRILIANGSATTPALAEACRYLAPETLSLLLDAGANPNCPGFINLNPLLFEMIGKDKRQNDIAILLIQRGADINAIKDTRWTPLMFAAKSAGTTKEWSDTWRLVRYMLEKTRADYNYAESDVNNM